MKDYQYGFDLGILIIWFRVSTERFEKKVAPLLLRSEQRETIKPGEVLPFFNSDLIMRDGWRLYRAVRNS